MIIPISIILIILQLSIIEPCVRTIPPEEVYITSAPDNLPFTEEPITNSPITVAPVTSAPSKVEPVTVAPVTASSATAAPITDAPTTPEPCTNCKSEDIQPTVIPSGTAPSLVLISGAGECIRVEAVCNRNVPCLQAVVIGIIAGQQYDISDTSSPYTASSVLECTNDMQFSHTSTVETLVGITETQCNYLGCGGP